MSKSLPNLAKCAPQTDTYALRWQRLQDLGFSSYQDYLASELWLGIRTKVFKECGRICFLCGAGADIVHPLGYGKDALLGRDVSKFAPLCNECHRRVEFTDTGKKRGLVNVHTTYRRLLKASRSRRYSALSKSRKKT